MAWETIEHSCGHEQRHNVTGNSAAKQRERLYLTGRDCTACRQVARRSEERARDAERVALARATCPDLPALEGTERQVAWAESIRARYVERWWELADRSHDPAIVDAEPFARAALAAKSDQELRDTLLVWGDWLEERSDRRLRVADLAWLLGKILLADRTSAKAWIEDRERSPILDAENLIHHARLAERRLEVDPS